MMAELRRPSRIDSNRPIGYHLPSIKRAMNSLCGDAKRKKTILRTHEGVAARIISEAARLRYLRAACGTTSGTGTMRPTNCTRSD